LAAHKLLRQASPDSGIVLFSEHPDLSREDRLAIMEQGGALEFLNFRDSAGDALLDEDQIARLSALVEARLFEKLISDFVRTRRKFTWDSQLEYSDADNTLYINLHKITQKQDVPPSTSSSGFQPSPIPQVTFDDVFGLERAKERLREAVAFMKDPGNLAAFGVAPPSGFLLAGPSGTGKTHLARAVANAANCVFYSLSAGELESKWVGESEERIRELFASARKYAPAVIFIDEIDAIATRREAMPSPCNHAVKLLNQLLVCMDGFSTAKGQVLVIAATNRPEALDPAVLRPGRFDETIRIEAPDAKAREQMFLQRLAKIPMDNREAIQSSAANLVCRTAGMSPAQIDRVIREAAYAAARENRKTISLSDIGTAIAFVRYGAAKRDMKITPKDRERTAWHEAGHAIARLTLLPESKLDYLSIVPNEDGSLGFAAWQEDESKHTDSAEDYKKLIMVSLAGREGEKLCPGAGADAINTGVSSDYERATHRAWQYVSRFGFDEEYGIFAPTTLPSHLQAELGGSIQPRVQA
jgi:ATP-dependent metalloprotease FtsH